MADAAEEATAGQVILSPAAYTQLARGFGLVGDSTRFSLATMATSLSNPALAFGASSSRSSLATGGASTSQDMGLQGSDEPHVSSRRASSVFNGFGLFARRSSQMEPFHESLDARLRRGARNEKGMYVVSTENRLTVLSSVMRSLNEITSLTQHGKQSHSQRWQRRTASGGDASLLKRVAASINPIRLLKDESSVPMPRFSHHRPPSIRRDNTGSNTGSNSDDLNVRGFRSFRRATSREGSGRRLPAPSYNPKVHEALRCFVPAVVEERVEVRCGPTATRPASRPYRCTACLARAPRAHRRRMAAAAAWPPPPLVPPCHGWMPQRHFSSRAVAAPPRARPPLPRATPLSHRPCTNAPRPRLAMRRRALRSVARRPASRTSGSASRASWSPSS